MTAETSNARGWVDLLERAVPFLHDEGAKYDDDGSNEPLELAREIETILASLPSDESALSSASLAFDGGREAATPPPAAARGEWVLVPRNPTEAMIDAWRDAPDIWEDAYAAMLAAAPQPPSAPVGVEDVDALAQEIRRVDGEHSLGASALAEALVPYLARTTLAQQPAAVDGAYPTPRNRAEAVALARLVLAHLGVIDAHIDAAIARCETNSAAQQQGPRT